MTEQQKAPAAPREDTRAIVRRYDKDNRFYLPFHQRRVFNLLSDGVPRSAADISAELRLSDPRGTIRCLRKRGIEVSDQWITAAHGSRFKRYFIRKEVSDE